MAAMATEKPGAYLALRFITDYRGLPSAKLHLLARPSSRPIAVLIKCCTSFVRLSVPCLPPCFALPRSILRTEDRRSLTRLSTRHTLLFLACCTHSATGNGIFVHCLISSVQRLRGLPRRLFPATMPCRTYVQRLIISSNHMAEVLQFSPRP